MHGILKYFYTAIVIVLSFVAVLTLIILVSLCVVSPRQESPNVMEEIMHTPERVYRRMPSVQAMTERKEYDWRWWITYNEKIYGKWKGMQPEIQSIDNEYGFLGIFVEMPDDGYRFRWIYYLEERKMEFSGDDEWQFRRMHGLNEYDMKKIHEELLFGVYLGNWFRYGKSDYTMENLGDVEIVDKHNHKAVYLMEDIKTNNPMGTEWDGVKMPQGRLEEIKESALECNTQYYGVSKKAGNEIMFKTEGEIPYYNEVYINHYLNDTGCMSYQILYADEKYFCIWKKDAEGEQETVLMDLYRINFADTPLSVGEGLEYGFRLPMTELEKKIFQGECMADSGGYRLAGLDGSAYAELLEDYFDGRKYMYRTYVTENHVGFLIPAEAVEDGYIRLEVEYDWKKDAGNSQMRYSPTGYKDILRKSQEELEKIRDGLALELKSWKTDKCSIETDLSVYHQTPYLIQVKCLGRIKDAGTGDVYKYRYLLFDAVSQKELQLDDILIIDDGFLQWLKSSGKVNGNLTKSAYSIEEGCERTKEMLRNCPVEKLEEALDGCEFYLEQEMLHLKLPYWNDGNGDTGWVSNGANGVWKSWLTIRTEDIKEFLKVEKW